MCTYLAPVLECHFCCHAWRKASITYACTGIAHTEVAG
jgi:hypothetical protein